ncbi:MAG: MBL fold metallo-hydrolase [Bacteroidetes bacterium]|nr:MBL fold metallo-hydrolase [Bacteroidota bacterium]
MQISFHGAARVVTGSKHLITLDNGKQILLDCGLFQGMGKETVHLNSVFGFEPAKVDVMVLSHAHIDHCGLVPKLVKEGFKGKIWCTSATADLAKILMRDSARIQESDIKYLNKHRAKENRELLEPLYVEEDAIAAAEQFSILEYGESSEILDGVSLLFTDAGHLLGSAAVNLTIQENGKTTKLTFSGDIGRYRDAILRSPASFQADDYVVMESTYGDKLHKPIPPNSTELLDWINHTCIEKKGKLVIPSFSVGRTQELLYQLNRYELNGKLPDLKYFVDSPLSITATEIIKAHPECFNAEVEAILRKDPDVFKFKGLTYTRTVEESMAINEVQGPCVIISSSGMAEAGRIKHHIVHNIDDKRNTILLVGYCDPRSLGGRLKAGDKEVRIFGKPFDVYAEVGSIESMSAHGDYQDLLHWLSSQTPSSVKKVFLVHGDYDTQQVFAEKLKAAGYNSVEIPEQHSVWPL